MNKNLSRTIKYLKKYRRKTVYSIIPIIFFCTIVIILGILSPKPNDNISPSNGEYLFNNVNPTFEVGFGDILDSNAQYVRFESRSDVNNPFEQEEVTIWDRVKGIFSKKQGFEMRLTEVRFGETDSDFVRDIGQEIVSAIEGMEIDDVKTSTEVVEVGRLLGESDNHSESKETVVNKDVYPGIDVEYQILEGLGVKEEIIIRDMDEYRSSCGGDTECLLPLNEFIFDLQLDNDVNLHRSLVSIGSNPVGTYYFTDKDGDYLAHFLPSFAFDNGGARTNNVDFVVEETGVKGVYEIYVTLDLEWLLSSERIFPVHIDPSVVHDTGAEFDAGSLNRLENATGPKVQLVEQESTADVHTVGLWHMNEGSGSSVADSSGNSNTGTATGTTVVTGMFDDARSLNGTSSDYITVTDNDSLDFSSTDFTLEAWINPGTVSSYGEIIGKGINTDYEIMVTDAGKIRFLVEDSGIKQFDSNTILQTSEWYHIAGVKTGSDTTGRIYINGELDATSDSFGDTSTGSTTNNLLIGARSTGTPALFFNGLIDEVRISNVARTPEEIRANAQKRPSGTYISSTIDLTANVVSIDDLQWTEAGVNTGDGETPYSTTGLVGQWDFNETSGTTADNEGSCGATCDGTLTNMTTTGQDDGVGTGWTAVHRKWGAGGLMFDGSNDYVNIPNSTLFDIANPSIEAWVYSTNFDQNMFIFEKGPINTQYSCFFEGTYLTFRTYNSVSANDDLDIDSSDAGIVPNSWNHIVCVYNGSTKKIYVNGIEKGSKNYTETLCTGQSGERIGAYGGGAPSYYFSGFIDVVRVYSRALSASEILSNYNSTNVEFLTRTSVDGDTWEAWKPTTGETQIESMDESTGEWWVDSNPNSSAIINKISGINDGDGADGAITITANKNINTDDMITGRSCADGGDAVNYSDTTLEKAGETSITLSSTPSSGCLVAGDEVMIINLQGSTSTYGTVGQYEIHTISSISTATLNFTDYPLLHTYDGTTQKIMVQRVPNYTNVTVNGIFTLTASTWDGTKGGLLFFRANGTVTVNSGGVITMSGTGYKESPAIGAWEDGKTGESYVPGQPNGTSNWYGGGGGGQYHYGVGGCGGAGGAGGGYGSIGSNGATGACSAVGGTGGIKYGTADLAQLFFGSGGGGSGDYHGGLGPMLGGKGGGIIGISANVLTGSGSILANGANGQSSGDGGGGGGSGGSIYLNCGTMTLSGLTVTASGGTGGVASYGGNGGAGGTGRIALYYSTSLSGSTTPLAYTQKLQSVIKQEGDGALQIQTGSLQIDSSTVGLWHLDESSYNGTTGEVKDSTGVNHGTANATTTTSIGRVGRAIHHGAGTAATVPDSSSLDITDYLTMEYWFKPDVDVVNMTSGWPLGVFKRDWAVGGYGSHFTKTTGTVNFQWCWSGSGSSIYSTTLFKADIWYHYAATYDGSYARLYINGVEESNLAVGTPMASSSGYSLLLGNPDFEGLIDEVRISNAAHSAEEINEAYRSGREHHISRTIPSANISSSSKLQYYIASDKPGTYLESIIGESAITNHQTDANTVGLWRMEEENGSGAYILDTSGYGNNGTPTGTTSVVGEIGKARSFNSTSDFIQVSDSNSLDLTTAGTIEIWAKKDTQKLYQMYVTKGHTQAYQLMDYDTTGRIIFRWGSDANNLITDEVVSTSQWNHIVGVYDGSKLKIYINGRLSKETSYTTDAVANITPVRIGARDDGYYFDGLIDEVRISNIARTATEIRQAYDIGKRTHPITIDFGASLDSGNLITGSSDKTFSIDATTRGLSEKGSGLYYNDKVIIKENYSGTVYTAQGDVISINESTGAVEVDAWDTGSTFPSGGYTIKTAVFKWQKEYMDLSNVRSDDINATTNISFKILDGNEGRSIWIDDIRRSEYLSNSSTTTNITSTVNRYIQYMAIVTTSDTNITPYISNVTINYQDGPTMDQVMRHGKWFDSSGQEQSFWWVDD